jgi:ActR/RegA family two-component response regulator
MDRADDLTAAANASPVMLFVDADRVTEYAFRSYFRRRGFAVDSALDRAAAEQLLAITCYDVVVTDLRLGTDDSIWDGIALVKLIRARCPCSRIIVLSGSGSSRTRAEAYAAGANTYLHKPQHLADIERTIRELVDDTHNKPVTGSPTDAVIAPTAVAHRST